jgi:hypothetical protein
MSAESLQLEFIFEDNVTGYRIIRSHRLKNNFRPEEHEENKLRVLRDE